MRGSTNLVDGSTRYSPRSTPRSGRTGCSICRDHLARLIGHHDASHLSSSGSAGLGSCVLRRRREHDRWWSWLVGGRDSAHPSWDGRPLGPVRSPPPWLRSPISLSPQREGKVPGGRTGWDLGSYGLGPEAKPDRTGKLLHEMVVMSAVGRLVRFPNPVNEKAREWLPAAW